MMMTTTTGRASGPARRCSSPDPSDAHPLRINLTLQLSVLDAARQRARLFVTKKVARYNFHGYRGERERKVEHDIWAFSSEPLVAPHEVEGFIFWISLTADGLIGNPIAGAHVWRRIVLVAIQWVVILPLADSSKLLGVAVALLTPLYWYTRKTSAGLSLWSIWTRVLVVVPSSIHYVATTQIDFIRDLTLMWWIVVALQCVGEYLQLRLVCPLDLRTARLGVTDRGGGVVQRVEERGSGVDIDFKLSLDGVFERRKWTHRERDTMRLEPSWKVAVGVSGVLHRLLTSRPLSPVLSSATRVEGGSSRLRCRGDTIARRRIPLPCSPRLSAGRGIRAPTSSRSA